ncbi:glycerophosphodiester phosphodiesterase [Jatrophihabitans sp. YIM 134969]
MVVAHRGASAKIAEHTLSAYVAAIETGADAVECDVRLTADGVLVCVHDRLIDRVSNGRGAVSELELAKLREMDFSSWHAELPDNADDLVDEEPSVQSVLTLEELLALLADAGRPMSALIETKHPTRYAGQVEKELVRMLERFGLAGADAPRLGRAVVMSFAKPALRRVRLLAPELPLVLLEKKTLKPKRVDGSLPRGVRIAGADLKLLKKDEDYVARVHARGNRVFCWTVDEPADIDLVLGLGVDGVISNRPGDVVAAVRARGEAAKTG